MKRRTLTILVLAALLALVAGTAIAGTIRTPFTGTGYISDWVTPDEYRDWTSGPNFHWRNDGPIKTFTTTDPRMSGTYCEIHNLNNRPSPDDPIYGVQGHMWGMVHIEADGDAVCWNATDYWEGNFVVDREPDGLEYTFANVKGYGAYEGLHAQLYWHSLIPDTGNSPYVIEGEIINPGGK